ncbi:hypothetical protein [Bradyrhizobium sp. URHC0002]
MSALFLQTGCGGRGVVMDSLMIGLGIVVALYIAVRLALRFYFPPDT